MLDKLAAVSQIRGLYDLKEDLSIKKNYILCVKQGSKYSSDYVNRLYNMCKRHCTEDYKFVCITDDPTGINPDIIIKMLPSELKGWWSKLYMFNPDLGLTGNILYLDLDVVVNSDLSKLFNYEYSKWCIVRDFLRHIRPLWNRYNSSVIRFRSNQLNFIWDHYKDNMKAVEHHYPGDQDYIYAMTKDTMPATFFPDKWIVSWKWEVRESSKLDYSKTKGNRRLLTTEDVTPVEENAICVFHGEPNPDMCNDPWVVDHWV